MASAGTPYRLQCSAGPLLPLVNFIHATNAANHYATPPTTVGYAIAFLYLALQPLTLGHKVLFCVHSLSQQEVFRVEFSCLSSSFV